MTFIAGAFTATWDAQSIGSTEDGFEISYNRIQEEIRTDMFRGLLDAVQQGIDMSIRMVLVETDFEAVRHMIWPFDSDWDGLQYEESPANTISNTGFHGGTGQLISALAKPLVLTPCSGTTAKTKGNLSTGGVLASITFARTVLSTDAVTLKYASALQKIPVTLTVLPAPLSPGDITAPQAYPYCNSPLQFFAVA